MLKANIKLYFHTLLASLKYLGIGIGWLVCGRLLLELFENVPAKGVFTFFFVILVMFLISIHVRSKDDDVFDAYLTATGRKKLSLSQDLKLLVHSKYFYIELGAFLTYLVVLLIFMGWILFATVAMALPTIFVLVFLITVYLILNTVSWLIVHAIYRKRM